jgi:hypothetical protein
MRREGQDAAPTIRGVNYMKDVLLTVFAATLPVSLPILIGAGLVLVIVIIIAAILLFRSGGKKKSTGSGTSDWQRQPQAGAPGAWNQQGGMGAPGGWNQPAAQQGGWGQPAQQQPGGWNQPAPQQPGDWGAQGVSGTQQAGGWNQPAPQQPGGWNQPAAPQQPGDWGAQGVSGTQQAGGWNQPAAQQQPGGWNQPAPQQGGWGEPTAAPAAQQDPWGQPQQQGAPSWGAQGQAQSSQASFGNPSAPSWGQPSLSGTPAADPWGAQGQQPYQGLGVQSPANNPPSWQQGGFGQSGPGVQQDAGAFSAGDGDRTMLRTTGPQTGLGIVRVEEGKEPGRIYEVRKESLSIGRSRESDIFLEDLAVSRLHASILNMGSGNYALKDEGSANGTKVNGQLVNKYQTYPLQEGDRIQLGQTVLIFTRR